MTKSSIRVLALSLLANFVVVAPSLAQDASGVSSDVGAVQKDNAAISKDETEIAKDRATKAQDKASGNWAGQAIDSVTLGADHIMHSEKGAEKSTDQTILNHDTSGGTTK